MNNFKERMSELSNDELLAILNEKRDDYVKEAIDAVEEILNERGVAYEKEPDEKFVYQKTWLEQVYASNGWIRYLDSLIDGFALYFVYLFIDTLLYICVPLTDSNAGSLYLLSIMLNFVALFLYYVLMESIWGKTVGKMVFGLSVVDKDGNKPTFKQIVLRTLCRFIPFEAFSFIGGGFKNHELKGNWHDKLSKTYVVRNKMVRAIQKQG